MLSYVATLCHYHMCEHLFLAPILSVELTSREFSHCHGYKHDGDTVQALTCPLRKTDLRFLCACLIQMHFSEDHTPAYNLNHLCF